jgi:energy-coupling factor transporter ATP-binding protein EcfA2
VKINTLSLTDFRAFPGPAPTTFELAGKNLLVYGENGSGKSSLFHALRGLFSYGPPPNLLDLRNSFSNAGIGNIRVEVGFDDSSAAAWTVVAGSMPTRVTGNQPQHGPFAVPLHPGHDAPINLRITEAAKFSATLDYRSLLNTNYKHGDGTINFFELVVNGILSSYVDLATNKPLHQLWQAVLSSMPKSNIDKALTLCALRCDEFNNAISRALDLLKTEAQSVLEALSPDGLKLVGLPFTKVEFNFAKTLSEKAFKNQSIGLEVTFHGTPLEKPQNFLNEARLTALGLSLYLGARLACAPKNTPTPHLKLLVLDDVLIGLDQSNRIPVLDVLKKLFNDWQIVLLTHDRLWFETTRTLAQLIGNWSVVELFANAEAVTKYTPTVAVREGDVVEDYLNRSTVHLANSDWRAAAVYARSAFEMWLKLQCAGHGIPIQYSLEPRKIDANVYFNAIEKWADNSQAKPAFSGVLNVLSLYRDTVFNPGSHSYPTTMSGGEQRAAITAMRFVKGATKHGQNALQIATNLIGKSDASPDELALAAGFLRVAFMRRLRELAKGKQLALPFTLEPHKITPNDLWAAMTTAGWPPKRNAWVAGINENKVVLLDTWTWSGLLSLTAVQLQAAMQAFKQH